jgi:uncharacterized SAM-binding protein YcdF (DUF218 family)
VRGRERGGGIGRVAVATSFSLSGALLALCLLAVLFSAATLPGAVSGRTALVLGAAQYNGHPSPAFRYRLNQAVRLYRGGLVERVVVSGGVGRGDRFSEGNVGREYLLASGLPARSVVAETRSSSTEENLRLSRSLVGGEPVTLVTDSLHAPRALGLAHSLGLSASARPVRVRARGTAFWHYALREALAGAAYALSGVR